MADFWDYRWWIPGQLESSYWLSFYEALRGSCDFAKLEGLIAVAENCALAWMFPDIVVFCGSPVGIRRNGRGQLHCETAAAVEWGSDDDGSNVYALNGVRMKREQVMTPAEQMDPQEILKEPNAEVRRELLRKIGIERFEQAAGSVLLDKKTLAVGGTYELLALDLAPELRGRKYLKMVNQSIGTYHMEGVPQECRTVEEALHSRKPAALRKIPLATDGEDWFLQGDVAIWPREAAAVKEFPVQVT